MNIYIERKGERKRKAKGPQRSYFCPSEVLRLRELLLVCVVFAVEFQQ